MTDESATPKPVAIDPFKKQFRAIRDFPDWLARWNAAETTEEALGLLHVLPKYSKEDQKLEGMKFLLTYLEMKQAEIGQPRWWFEHRDADVYVKAFHVLVFQFLKWSFGPPPAYFHPFRTDPTLYPQTLRVLSLPMPFDQEAVNKIVHQFAEDALNEYLRPQSYIRALVEAHLMALLPLLPNLDQVRTDTDKEPLWDAMRTLALSDHFLEDGSRPSLEDVLRTDHSRYAAKLILREAFLRGKHVPVPF